MVGPSSVGKSFTQNRVLELMPPEDVLNLAGMTTAAFLRHADLRRNIVVLNEHFGDAVLQSLLRQLVSEGRVYYEHVIRDEIMRRQVIGPTVVLDTTIDMDLLDFQNRNRSLVLNFRITPDDLFIQLDRIKRRHTAVDEKDVELTREIISRHHELQKCLKNDLRVVIPFAGCIEFSPVYPHHKRLFENFLTLIETIAFLDQEKRPHLKDAKNRAYIEATNGDFEDALRLLLTVSVETGSDTLPDEALLLLQTLKHEPERFCTNTSFTVYEAVECLNRILPADRNSGRPWTLKRTRRALAMLENEMLVTRTGGKHNIALYRMVEVARKLPVKKLCSCLRSIRLNITDVTSTAPASSFPALSTAFPPRDDSSSLDKTAS